MSIEMDLDDTSELSSVASEPDAVQEPRAKRRSTRQTSSKQAAASTSELPRRGKKAAARKGKARLRDDDDDDEADIAVPAADAEGNLLPAEDDDDEEESDEDNDDEEDEDFAGPQKRKSAAGRPGGGATRARKTGGGARSARQRRPSKAAVGGEDDARDEDGNADAVPARGKDDFSIEPDNKLFNAVKDPRSAIAATVEDWLDNYRADEDTRGQALADLINFVLRCCGCNLSVDRYEAQDLDGVVNKLDDIQTEFAKVEQASYPLASKSKNYKKFGASLAEFLGKLVEATAVSDVLYDDVFCETFQSWLVALSSSKLRAFRHTSTVVTLLLVQALCECYVTVQEDFAQLQRQKEAEVKRSAKTTGKSTRTGSTDKTRLKELEALIKSTHSHKVRLESYFKEMFDAVFIHRYRDAEPAIRTECIKSLGMWMSSLPDYWLEGNYLRYVGWMLTDLDKAVRREAVVSLASLYEKDDYISGMQHFTERFKGRLVEMANSDSELVIRIEAIQVLRQIDRHGLLEDDQRDEVGRLVFDAEPRLRRAAGSFFDSLLREQVEDQRAELEGEASGGRRNGQPENAEERENQLQWKCLASLLVKFSEQLDAEIATQLQAIDIAAGGNDNADDDDGEDETEGTDSAFARYRRKRDKADAALRKGTGSTSTAQLSAVLQGQNKDRITLAIESLYYDCSILREWESLMAFLLLDHSAGKTRSRAQAESRPSASRPTNGGNLDEDDEDLPGMDEIANGLNEPASNVPPACRLTDPEETLLLTALVTVIKTARFKATLSGNQEEREEAHRNTTRNIMTNISRLFAKHQTDVTRCMVLLLLPQHMDLQLYLEMRQITAYEQLWDDVTKQFSAQHDAYLLERAMETIQHLRQATVLSATNTDKVQALEMSLSTQLQRLLDGIDANNATPLDEDAIEKTTGCLARISLVIRNWDILALVEAPAASDGLSLFALISQLAERGQMGFDEESKLVQHCLGILYYCYLWKVTKLSTNDTSSDALLEERDTLLDLCKGYAVGDGNTAPEDVKRTAFKVMLDTHIASKARFSARKDQRDLVVLNIQTQYRCSGFLSAEIERYAALFNVSEARDAEEPVNENEDEDDNDAEPEHDNKAIVFRPVTLSQHSATFAFNDLIVSFTRAICVGVLDLYHSTTLLTHFDRFGPFFDECCKWLGDAVRHFAVLRGDGHSAASVAFESLKGAIELYLSGSVKTEAPFLALSKHISNHLVMRGKVFSIAARLPSEDLIKLHENGVSYTIKKAAALAGQEKHVSKNKVLTMFKGLTLCLIGMDGREAAAVHAVMDKTLKDAKLEPSPTSRHWEGQRVYERRLLGLMSKDAGIKLAARRTVRKPKATETAEEDADENDGSQLPSRVRPKAKPKVAQKAAAAVSKPPSRRSQRAGQQYGASKRPRYDEGSGSDGETDGAEEGQEEEDQEDNDVQEVQALPLRGSHRQQTKNAAAPADNETEEDDEEVLPPPLRASAVTALAAFPSGNAPDDADELESLLGEDGIGTPMLDTQSDSGEAQFLPRRKRTRF